MGFTSGVVIFAKSNIEIFLSPTIWTTPSKLLGESEAQRIPNHIIVRTNFVGKKKWLYPGAFTDRFGTYLFADKVANGIKEICENNLQGIVHIVGDKKISMFDLAKITTSEVKPITLNDYTGPPLTIDMSLDTERWKKYKLEKWSFVYFLLKLLF